MDYNEVWFSRSNFHEKAKKKSTGWSFSGCRSKTPNLAKKLYFLAFLALSSEMINMF